MPDPQTPAAELRQAAERLRDHVAAVKRASHTDWGDLPWAADECSDDAAGNCRCIVYHGVYRPHDEPQIPPIQYVADAETAGHASFICLMHPGVALALAGLLEAEASSYEVYESANLDRAQVVARAVLGTGEQG